MSDKTAYVVHEELTHGPSGTLVKYWEANAPQAHGDRGKAFKSALAEASVAAKILAIARRGEL